MDFFREKLCKSCTSVEEMLRLSKKFESKRAEDNKEGAQQTPSTSEISLEEALQQRNNRCPVDKDELGRSTWKLLHTMSVKYSENPTGDDKKAMQDTLTGLSKTYPCEHCAEDFRKDIKEHPPKLENRNALAQWMCELHNRVNRKIGKDEFDCSKTMERWLDGWKDGSCDY